MSEEQRFADIVIPHLQTVRRKTLLHTLKYIVGSTNVVNAVDNLKELAERSARGNPVALADALDMFRLIAANLTDCQDGFTPYPVQSIPKAIRIEQIPATRERVTSWRVTITCEFSGKVFEVKWILDYHPGLALFHVYPDVSMFIGEDLWQPTQQAREKGGQEVRFSKKR